MYLDGLAEAVVRHGGRIFEGTKYWTAGEEEQLLRFSALFLDKQLSVHSPAAMVVRTLQLRESRQT